MIPQSPQYKLLFLLTVRCLPHSAASCAEYLQKTAASTDSRHLELNIGRRNDRGIVQVGIDGNPNGVQANHKLRSRGIMALDLGWIWLDTLW
jgi:hypothetical protein